MGIKSRAISVGGKTKVVQKGSQAESKYLSQGGSLISGNAGTQAKESRRTELKDLNRKGSSTYIPTPDDPGMENMDVLANQKVAENPLPPNPSGSVQKPATPVQPQVGTSPATLTGEQALKDFGYSNMDTQELAGAQSWVRKGFEQMKDTPAPAVGGDATALSYQPPAPQTSPADELFATDEGGFWGSLQSEIQDYFSPKNQRESLTKEYQKMLRKSGVEEMDMELIDMKNVIDGSEDDIRNEITKAGGFATDSNVLALTNARNKQLIKNYNTLLETRNAKQQYLDKMMDLSVEDRRMADADFDRKMNFAFKIQDYRDKMQTNAVNSFNSIVDKVGYQGLADMAQGDPHYTSLIEKTLGLGTGGLARLAAQPDLEREYDEARLYGQQLQNRKLEMELSGESGIDSQLQAIYGSDAPSSDKNGAALTSIIKSGKIGQGTKTQLANILGVINASEDLAKARQTTGFKGVNPLNALADIKIPFTDIGIIPFRQAGRRKESTENLGYIEAINLKVQQWASGAALTKEQTEQVAKFTPNKNDRDDTVRTKLNNLSNFMLTQAKSQLQSEGVSFEPEKVNLFEIYDFLQEASPEQIQELKDAGLI